LPSTIAVNSTIFRRYNEQLSRSLIEDLPPLPVLKQRHFMFDWDYQIGYNLTKSLQFNFRASNNYIYDDFDSTADVNLFENLFTIGRPEHYHQTLSGTYKLPINKLPYLDFVSADYTFTADFDWQAATPSYVNVMGNTIQNANTQNWGADLDFNKFYKTIGLTKLFGKKAPSSKSPPGANGANNNQVKKPKKGVNDVFANFITMIKKVRFNYTENNGTFLQGYIPEIGFLGRDQVNGSLAPTLGFVFGSQIDIRQKAIENGWLVSREADDPYYNKTYSQTHRNTVDYNVTAEPFRDFDIDLRGDKTYTRSSFQQLDVVNNELNTNSPVTEYGNFAISYNIINTAFKNARTNFETFKANREIIAQRLASETGQPVSGFGVNSQQVMLPAFLAAYTGKDASNIKLGAFRDVPIPGWNVTYKGLMRNKWFKKHFRNFSLSHRYNSKYAILSYTNNLEYNVENPYAETDISGNYFNKTLFNNINLIEEFSPLIKVDMKMKNSVSFSGQINKDRSLTLNFNNNTVAQAKGIEYIVGLGYRIKDLAMNFRFGGKKTRLKGDLNLRADVALRDNEVIVRAIDEDNNQVTGGQRLLSLKFFADYALSRNFTASFYFDQSASSYAISTTFPRQSISSGLSVRYILGN